MFKTLLLADNGTRELARSGILHTIIAGLRGSSTVGLVKICASGVVIAVLMGCSTKTVGVAERSDLVARGTIVQLEVKGEGIDPIILATLRRHVWARLSSAELEVTSEPPATVVLSIEVEAYESGNRALRLLFSFGAGRAKLAYRVTLFDSHGKVLAELEAEEIFGGFEPAYSFRYGPNTPIGGESTVRYVLASEAATHVMELVHTVWSEDDFTVDVWPEEGRPGVRSEVMLWKSPVEGDGTGHRHAAYFACALVPMTSELEETVVSTTLIESTEDPPPASFQSHTHEYVVRREDWARLLAGLAFTTEPDESGHGHRLSVVKLCREEDESAR